MKSLVKVLIISLGLLSEVALAQPKIPLPDSFELSRPIAQGEVPRDDQSILGVQLGKTALETAMRSFGSSSTFRIGGEGSARLLCIQSADSSDNTVVVFESGALGGWKIVTTFYVSTTADLDFDRGKCASSSKVNRNIATKAGLRIGVLQDKILRRFSVPSGGTGDLIQINFIRPVTHKSPNRKFELMTGVLAGIKNGKVAWIAVYRVEAS